MNATEFEQFIGQACARVRSFHSIIINADGSALVVGSNRSVYYASLADLVANRPANRSTDEMAVWAETNGVDTTGGGW